jgi:hypothetical protein
MFAIGLQDRVRAANYSMISIRLRHDEAHIACPITMIWGTLSACTANSIAALIPWG